ncbi:hypothetical protein NP233_g8330 [Leucocoprinus birnbaumii]|uniref:Nudix hydrolase domain-containing protein n=1 Tax=Leucocoprinus birnbaumii TaxID=56174 RepID=A0AAD5VMK9_9AGAR|nr:hypothetical protein NP233_g8330 [Leucocoprinus birnbaumii]
MASSSPEFNPSAPKAQPRFSYKDASHEEVLEDLSSRFILNLPDEELASLERICFQVEQAHWFYEDFIREQNPTFPSLPLKKFSAMLFHACPLLHQWSNDHENAFNIFMQYKTRVPVCGAIMLNDSWDKCVLVKGWKSSSGWGFPKGKINEDEPKHICAIREVLEETGYNLAGKLDPDHVIELSIKEQRISLFVVPGVEEDFPFQTKTRKEISRIEWFRLADLPTWKRNKQVPGKFYLISPFIGPLKAFMNQHKLRPAKKAGRQKRNQKISQSNTCSSDAVVTDADTDTIQESDSQMSDHQTEQSELLSAINGRNTSGADDALKSDNLDPHFARLLNSLTLSAMGNSSLAPNTILSPSTDPATPIPSTLNRDLVPDSLHEERQAPGTSEPHGQNLSPSYESARDSSCTPIATSNHPSSPPYSPSHIRQPSRSPVQKHNSDTFAAATSPVSRRAIRTDISPYLTKASADNTSAKRLQQLALLEKVADESARMLPQARAATAAPPTIPAAHPGSATSVPSQISGGFSPHAVYYSSSPPQLPGSSVQNAHAYLHGGYSGRAHTSQAFRGAAPQPLGSQSMNQAQLLALMNHPQVVPSIQRPASNFAPRAQPYSHAYNSMSAFVVPPGPAIQPLYQSPGNMPPNFPPHGVGLPGPNRFASATPAVDSFPPRTVSANTAQTLLSILNGNRPLQSNPVVAPSTNRSI